MATKTMQIVRKLAGKDASIFNDKLKGGGRSIKVWRWGKADYVVAQAALEAEGLQVTMHENTYYDARGGKDVLQTRLHVVE